ncbi:hypothetical protein ABPG77_003215 [Micractinium sp. CCAP 211/92]
MQQQDPESSGQFALGQAAAAGDSSVEQAGRREAGGAANSEGEEEEGFDAELGTWLAGRLQRMQPDAELDSGSVRVLGRLLDELTARVLDEACRVNAASAACAAADAPADSSAEAGPAAHAGSSGAEHQAGCGHKLSTLTSLDIHKALKRVLPGEPSDGKLRPYLPSVTKQAWHLDKQSLKGIKRQKQAVAVDGAAAAATPPDLPPSQAECWEPKDPPGTPPDARTAWCRVSNLYLYQGTAYYVNAERRQLPTVQYGRPLLPKAVTPDAFRALLAPGADSQRVQRAYVMRSSVQGHGCSQELAYVNFGDGMTERITTLWMFLCQIMGHCSYADRSNLQLIDAVPRMCRPDDPPSGRDAYPAWYREVLSCISAQPVRHLNGSWREAVVRVDEAWLGLGPRCRSHYGHCHDGSRGKAAPTPRLLASWRDTLGACLGFPTAHAAPVDPVRIMIVDRAYESHRHLLNVNTLLRALRRRYSPQRVAVSLHYMEDLSVAEQFRLWAQQTVVVHVHGSNIGHWQGLPHGAVVIKIAPFKDTYTDAAYGNYLARDYGPVNNLTWIPLVNIDPNYLHKATEHRPLSDPRYKDFSDRDKLELLAANCGALQGEEKRKICERAIKFNMNLVVRPEALITRVDAAIQAAFAKQGRQPPADLLASTAGTAGAAAHAGGEPGLAADAGAEEAAAKAEGAVATAGLFLLARSRRWLMLLPGRRRHAPASPGLFGK